MWPFLDYSTPLRSEYLMRVATLTTWNENARGAEIGDHKGRPYDEIVGAYFRSNDNPGRYFFSLRNTFYILFQLTNSEQLRHPVSVAAQPLLAIL